VAGLAINLVAAWLLSSGKQNLNVRAALLHVMGDLLGSVAALISGIVIVWTGWTTVDPILSLVIALLILLSSFGILRDALHALMEGVPTHLDLDEIGHALAQIEGVRGVHDLHIWSLSAERTALSAHLLVRDMGSWPEVLRLTNELLQERFDIVHSTLQPEPMEQLVPLQIRPHDPCPESEAPSG